MITTGLGAAALLDQLASAVLLLDGSLRIRYLNSATEMLFGASARRLMDTSLRTLIAQGESLAERLLEALGSETPYTERELHLNLESMVDPASVVVDCMVTPIRLTNGARALLLELHQQDRHLRISREENLQTQQQASRAVVRGLAHEIKNPLGGLRGAAQLLDAEIHDPELRDYTRVIMAEADRLQQLVDTLLGSQRLPRMVEVNIHEVMERVRTLVAAEGHPGITVRSDYDPSLPLLRADPDQLIQAVLNIVRNAIEAVLPQSRRHHPAEVILSTRAQRQFTIGHHRHRLVIRVDVIDNGPGIPPDFAEQIFYPMVTGRAEGTGLGLSIAQDLIARHGGTIECHSRPGETRFSIFLPLQQAQK
ncbi:MAG TPA: nitrogen regulation protein NR(II) [Candidatus Acidoferrales bacterium]|nr:nitrogen regulation protein NR(II) [Candidatus Acidoferrales bacterium]